LAASRIATTAPLASTAVYYSKNWTTTTTMIRCLDRSRSSRSCSWYTTTTGRRNWKIESLTPTTLRDDDVLSSSSDDGFSSSCS